MKRKRITVTKLTGSTKTKVFQTCLLLHRQEKTEILPERWENPLGILNLSKTYDHVVFTDSYKDWSKEMEIPANCTMAPL